MHSYRVPDLLLGEDDVLLRVGDQHEGEPALLLWWCPETIRYWPDRCIRIPGRETAAKQGEKKVTLRASRCRRFTIRKGSTHIHEGMVTYLAVDLADREARAVDGDVPVGMDKMQIEDMGKFKQSECAPLN